MAGDPEGAEGPSILRDPDGAARDSYDLIVVGGGIYGCMLALESARRGLRPLLLERDDFGQHTSANSLGILHGGLRYLQSLNLRRFRESVSERRWFLGAFPDLLRPFPFLMPLYGAGLRRPSVLRAALATNDLLSWRRNRELPPHLAVPPGRILPPDLVKDLFPGVQSQGLLGGALWHDAVMPRPQRIIMEVLRWAVARGAVALNYTEVDALETVGGRVQGVRARDTQGGSLLVYRAPVVVNCAGPWVREFARGADRDLPTLFRPSLALNLLLDLEPDFQVGVAVSPAREDGATYFLYPWQNRVLAGTYHAPGGRGPRFGVTGQSPGPGDSNQDRDRELGNPDLSRHQNAPIPALVEAFVNELQGAAPSLGLSQERVLRVLWGRLPVVEAGTTRLAAREVVHDHGRNGGPEGLLSVSGVKFTVARRVAGRVLEHLGRRGLAAPLAPPRDAAPPPTLTPSREEISELLASDPKAAVGVIGRLAERESVVRPEDLLLRRTDWAMDPKAGEPLERIVEDVIRTPARLRGR